jgi:hypothetical protein
MLGGTSWDAKVRQGTSMLKAAKPLSFPPGRTGNCWASSSRT